jgi:YggT family protein
MNFAGLLIQIIDFISRILIILVIIDVVLSYFMSPYHPVKMTIGRIVEPLLAPIRRIIPPVQMIDFSPIILIILIQVIDSILGSLLGSLR